MSVSCEYKELPAQPTLAVRVRTRVEELPQVLGKWYGAIASYLAELGEQPTGAPFAAYYNMDIHDLDVGIGFPVDRALPDKGEITSGEIPGGGYAVCLYAGPYSELGTAYDVLNEWVTTNGHTPTGLVYEMYLDDPATTPQKDLKTLILFRVD